MSSLKFNETQIFIVDSISGELTPISGVSSINIDVNFICETRTFHEKKDRVKMIFDKPRLGDTIIKEDGARIIVDTLYYKL